MTYKTVIFDFDSTLVTVEGINELARLKGVYDQVSRLTDAAMTGETNFEEIFYSRLLAVKPTLSDLQELAKIYKAHITPGAKELIIRLLMNNVEIFVVSGGYEQAILPVTTALGIPSDHVYTISLQEDSQGFYTQVAHHPELIRHHGKAHVVQSFNPPRKSVFIGDGATDVMARSAVDTFIGFGGVTVRSLVKQQADIFVDLPSLMSVYNLIT